MFADIILRDPKISGKEAIKRSYGKPGKPVSDRTAEVMASENLRKPEIMIYLENHAQKAEQGIIEIAEYSKEYGKTGDKVGAGYASVALASYKDILDRVHGKATQKVESTSRSVNINLDLTSVTDEPKA